MIHDLVLLFSRFNSSVECLKSDLRIRFSYEVITFCVDLIRTTHESRIYEVSSECVCGSDENGRDCLCSINIFEYKCGIVLSLIVKQMSTQCLYLQHAQYKESELLLYSSTTRECMTDNRLTELCSRKTIKRDKCLRTVIHSVTSTRLLFKHRNSSLQVVGEMTSLTTRGFNVLQCLLRAEETRQISGCLQVLFGLTSLQDFATKWCVFTPT